MNTIVSQEKKWLLAEKYNGSETEEYKAECLLLEAGVPVAYLIGNIEFLGCHIDLSAKPLIPRGETEYWVDLFIKQVKEKYSEVELHNLQILDLFAGSGCIGVACAKHLRCQVTIGEIQEQNLSQILQNTSHNKCITNTEIIKSDVFSHIPKTQYDFILANPPYIDHARETDVQSSVLDNEDHVALFAEKEGLQYVYQLIDKGSDYLRTGGEIWIEFDPWQTDLIDLYLKDNATWTHAYLQDQYKKDRVLILVKK